MKRIAYVCCIPFIVISAFAQITVPRSPDTRTMLLWHLDESTPAVAGDAGVYFNSGTATGTKVVAGRAGQARSFNGTSDYITLADPGNGTLSFGPSESFTVECWFKTSSPNPMELIRKGLAPDPGFTLIVSAGKVVGIIGNRSDGTPPDALLTITSDSTYNDGTWHHAMLIRDRAMQKLYLYVDGGQATAPLTDTFPYAIESTRPLTVGRWENEGFPYFFDGVIDEVRIARDARHPRLVTPVMALWNFDADSTAGVVRDSSGNFNSGLVTGTTLTPGVTGSARLFNGVSDYIIVNDPETGSLDFDTSQSFTIEAWFKTTSSAPMQVVRKGLAPEPGYGLFVSGGYADAVIGNREDGTTPDTLLIMHSAQKYNDGLWHRETLVRDRTARTVSLYVDGRLVVVPMTDPFPKAIASDRPLTIGRWEPTALPYFYQGALDRVMIARGALHPASPASPGILVHTETIDHGPVVIGDSVSKRLTLFNTGGHDSLLITGITTTAQAFVATPARIALGPHDTASIVIRYKPSAVRADTGTVRFTTNDTARSFIAIPLQGSGIAAPSVTMLLPLNNAVFNQEIVTFSWRKPSPVPAKYWLEWSTSPFFVERSVDSTLTDSTVQKAGFAKNTPFYWRVRAGSALGWGEFTGYRMFFRGATSVENGDRPTSYDLMQNYPNPFNPTTTIAIRMPEASFVRLEIFTMAGELVRVAAEGTYQPGEYRILFDGTGLPSGTYFARMRTGTTSLVRPMLLMK